MNNPKDLSENLTRYLGQVFELEINDTTRGGAGIGRLPDGPAVFIPFTAPGDRIRAKITRAEKRYLEGRLEEMVQPSSQRVLPRCRVFGECGGCEWQHLPYDVQWKTKTQGVSKALERVGILDVDFDSFPSDTPWSYRNRIQLRSENGNIGFFRKYTRDLVSIDRCEIAREELNETLSNLKKDLRVEQPPSKYEIEVRNKGEIKVFQNQRHAAGGFRQVHDSQNQNLRNWVADKIESPAYVLDLYGGHGNFSKALSEKLVLSHCVDLGVPSGDPSEPKISFHRSDVGRWLSRERKQRKYIEKSYPWTILLDPPREGLGPDSKKIAANLRELSPKDLFLINCDPDRWASDLKHLFNQGFQIQKAAIFDFFPQTHHVEVAAYLSVR